MTGVQTCALPIYPASSRSWHYPIHITANYGLGEEVHWAECIGSGNGCRDRNADRNVRSGNGSWGGQSHRPVAVRRDRRQRRAGPAPGPGRGRWSAAGSAVEVSYTREKKAVKKQIGRAHV